MKKEEILEKLKNYLYPFRKYKVIGCDIGSKDGDKTCVIEGRKKRDGTLKIKSIKFITP